MDTIAILVLLTMVKDSDSGLVIHQTSHGPSVTR